MKLPDISKLRDDELRVLNEKIVERLRQNGRDKAAEILRTLRVGRTIFFRGKGGPFAEIHGAVITKINSTSVTCEEIGNGRTWRVHPTLVRLTEQEAKES